MITKRIPLSLPFKQEMELLPPQMLPYVPSNHKSVFFFPSGDF